MSQGVFGWRAKATGLGLLASLAILSGATCIPSSVDEILNQTGGTSGSSSTGASQGASLSLTVLSPVTDLTIQAGTIVQTSWTLYTNGQAGQLKVFYDDDNAAANGFHILTLIDTSSPTAATRYSWDTTGMSYGTYYLGAELTVGTTTIDSYAIGRVTIAGSVTTQQYSLDQLGTTFKGCVFEGFSFAGRLGSLMTGRFDMLSETQGASGAAAPDGVSDFIMVAPQADSHYTEDPEVGEAYLIFGWDGRFGTRSTAWYSGAHFSVNSVGSDPNVPGAILVGPGYITSSMGISAVMPMADVDNDGGAELMFGIPELINGRFEDQDYDPCDHERVYQNAPLAAPNPSINPPAGVDPDDHDWYGGLIYKSGYVVVLGSTTPNLYNVGNGLGGVVHLDEVGQTTDPAGPPARDRRGRDIDPALGIRLYPYARLARYSDFLQNDYRFGAALGTEDVDGDGVPDWLIAEPMATNGAGDISIGYSLLAGRQGGLWTGSPGGGSSCFSWPYFVCRGQERWPVWPFGMIDWIRGDEMGAPNGQLTNPIGVGDFSNDGLGDVACSTPNYSAGGVKPQAGAAYIVFGRAPFGDHSVAEIKDPVTLSALPGIYIQGTAAGDEVGKQMTAFGRPNWGMPGGPRLLDFNADGHPDWVIAAPGRDIPGKADAGAIAIIWANSRLDGRFTWDQITTGELPGIIITGSNQGDRFGEYMVEGGDINGDGSDDLIISAPGAENPLTGAQDAGAVYIIYGPPSSGAELNSYQALSGTYNINDLMASGPIKVRAFYGSMQGHRIGPVGAAGDIDNDGFEDILIGDPTAAPLGRTDAGQVFLVFGSQY